MYNRNNKNNSSFAFCINLEAEHMKFENMKKAVISVILVTDRGIN